MSNTSLVAARLELTDAGIVAELNALTVRKTDSTGWTWSGLGDRFPVENVIAIRSKLSEMGEAGQLFKDLLISTPGVNFALDKTQTQLEAMRPAIGDMVDVLKAIGVWHISPWKDAGNVADATIEEVVEIRAQIVSDAAKAVVESKWVTVQNEIVNPMLSAGNSWNEIKAAIAGVE